MLSPVHPASFAAPSRCTRFFPLALALIAAAAHSFHPDSARAATIDVTAYGATGNGSTDDTAAIQSAINASASGDTIYFPGGTYKISATLSILSNRTYVGEFAGQVQSILSEQTANLYAAELQSGGQNVTLTGLTFQNNGFTIDLGHTPANGVKIENCTFQNIPGECIYVTVGATNMNIVGNTFLNDMGDNGLVGYLLNGCTFTDNYFNMVNEGCHLSGTCTNVTIARNTGINMHRMGIEIQGSGYQNLLVEDNDFSNWYTPNESSFGLSIVPSSGPNVVTQYNTLLGRPAAASGHHYGDGLEIGGDQTNQWNFVEGYSAAAV